MNHWQCPVGLSDEMVKKRIRDRKKMTKLSFLEQIV